MNVNALENSFDNIAAVNAGTAPASRPNEAELRRTAQQFEAILLMQLTSALNAAGDEDDGEEKLYGSDGGSGLAKKMFAEQLATTISESGGVGLADLIMGKFNGAGQTPVKTGGFSNAVNAVRDIRGGFNGANTAPTDFGPAPTALQKDFVNGGDPSEVQIVSRFSDEIANDTEAEKSNYLTLDGVILNSTRPRIAPLSAVSSPDSAFSTIDSVGISALPAGKVRFQMPLTGRISSDFGSRFHPIDKKIKFHGGIDIAVPKGTPVGAAADGIVKFAGWQDGYGNVVVIRHADGSETLYGHNSRLLIAEGQPVAAGEPIALSGSTGKSTGPHLHFEVRIDGEPVNPHKILANVLPTPRR